MRRPFWLGMAIVFFGWSLVRMVLYPNLWWMIIPALIWALILAWEWDRFDKSKTEQTKGEMQ